MATKAQTHPTQYGFFDFLGDIGNGIINGIKSVFSFLGNIAGNILSAFTERHKHVSYGFGSKSLNSGSIDCSGWVHQASLHMMREINAKHPGTFDISKANKMLSNGAAWQIESFQKAGLALDPKSLHDGTAPVGTIIGIRRSNVPGWASGRPNGISHIVMIAEKDGKKYISESGGSGVKLTPYDQWMKRNTSAKLFPVNLLGIANKDAIQPTPTKQHSAPFYQPAAPPHMPAYRPLEPVRQMPRIELGQTTWRMNMQPPIMQMPVSVPKLWTFSMQAQN
ncbi:MAG: hypothetical protein K2Q32_09405 [Alphaproteobacteria bacterium]|nr:hypothetical protein [Alphaproteobacteria bacterium]